MSFPCFQTTVIFRQLCQERSMMGHSRNSSGPADRCRIGELDNTFFFLDSTLDEFCVVPLVCCYPLGTKKRCHTAQVFGKVQGALCECSTLLGLSPTFQAMPCANMASELDNHMRFSSAPPSSFAFLCVSFCSDFWRGVCISVLLAAPLHNSQEVCWAFYMGR